MSKEVIRRFKCSISGFEPYRIAVLVFKTGFWPVRKAVWCAKPCSETAIKLIEMPMKQFETHKLRIETSMVGIETCKPQIEMAMVGIETAMVGIETHIPRIEASMIGNKTDMTETETAKMQIEKHNPRIETTLSRKIPRITLYAIYTLSGILPQNTILIRHIMETMPIQAAGK